MNHRVRITAGGVSLEAEREDNRVAQAIWDVLPVEQSSSTWGDEIYFPV